MWENEQTDGLTFGCRSRCLLMGLQVQMAEVGAVADLRQILAGTVLEK